MSPFRAQLGLRANEGAECVCVRVKREQLRCILQCDQREMLSWRGGRAGQRVRVARGRDAPRVWAAFRLFECVQVGFE